ncbi:MAG: twin-arginine translocase subunit TatC [Candidatus Omnitrophica bacterium]|nr:twin-arginine translocase subunit TatC [Candidatus Omnitrophota bacterium]
MTGNFWEHLEELRRRLGVCLAVLLAASGIGLWQADRLIEWLRRPAGYLLPRLAFFSPTEALVAYMKVAVGFGLALSLPVVLYQAWAFVRPALTRRERAYGLALVSWGSALFGLGVLVGYGMLLPFFLRFLLTVGGTHLEPVISISGYLSFVLGTLLVCGALCELPLVIAVLSRLGIVTPKMLQRRRHLALLGIVVAAAVLSPTTDALTLLLLTIPLVVLYELSIIVASWSARSH